MDGFWRHGGKPADLLPAMQAKQDRNFARTWPDWRTMGEDQAIEHDRSGEVPPPPAEDLAGQGAIEELARIRAIIPASLTFEVPDVAEAIRSTFREYVKVAAEATALRKQLDALKAALGAPFMTCRSGDGKPQVRLQYQHLHDAQQAHSALVALFADRSSR